MIAITKSKNFDTHDVIRRSNVKHIPGAEGVLRDCMYRSVEVRVGMLDGVIACAWGLIPPTILSDTAWLWLIATDIVAEHKFLFVRHSQRYIEEALKEYPNIIGNTEVVNHSARRWLRWLGAEFGEPEGKMIPFIIKAKALNA